MSGSTARPRPKAQPPFTRQLATLLRPDAVALSAMAAYAVAGVGLAATVDDLSGREIVAFIGKTVGVMVIAAPVMLVLWQIGMNLILPERRSLTSLASEFTARRRAAMAAATIRIMAVVLAYATYAMLKRLLPMTDGFVWDSVLADIDVMLHGGFDPVTVLNLVTLPSWLRRTVELNYGIAWVVVTIVMMVAISTLSVLKDARSRYLLIYLFVLAGLGNAVAWLLVSAGPIFYDVATGDHLRFVGLAQALEAGRGASFSVVEIRDYLYALHSMGVLDVGTGISAFPSVHVGMATLLYVVVADNAPRARFAAGGYLLLILATSVYLGWHYAIDGYASILGVLAFNAVLKRWSARSRAASPLAPATAATIVERPSETVARHAG